MNKPKLPRMRYATEQRLRLLDFLLAQYGYVNRCALMDYFGISTPQASADISEYLSLCPGNAAYDLSQKCYVRSQNFVRYWP